jgi:hypothetical protein
MRSALAVTFLATLVALLGLAPATATAAEPADTGTEITFRAAPTGLVVPSVFVANNEAEWVHDPAEDGSLNEAPGVAGCQLTVEDRNGDGSVDGADVLHEAAASGCIDGWAARGDSPLPTDTDTSPSCADGPLFVASVDGLQEVYPASFWIVHRNGETANSGICGMALEDGESLGFVYE